MTAVGAASPPVGAPEGATDPSSCDHIRFPGTPPERVGLQIVRQSRPERILDDIASDRLQVFLAAYRSVMKATHPYSTTAMIAANRRMRSHRLHAIHQMRQRLAASQSQENMKMIGHQHPALRRRIAPDALLAQNRRCSSSACRIGKMRAATCADSGHEVIVVRERHAAFSQRSLSGGLAEWIHTGSIEEIPSSVCRGKPYSVLGVSPMQRQQAASLRSVAPSGAPTKAGTEEIEFFAPNPKPNAPVRGSPRARC